jgi:hypothetical protein
MRDVAIWETPRVSVVVSKVETDGGRLWVSLEFERGPETDEDEWRSAISRALSSPPDADGIRVRCIAHGHSSRRTYGSFAGGISHLSAHFQFERATLGSRVLIGWPKMGLPETTVEVG